MGIMSGTVGSKYVTPSERDDLERHQASSALFPTTVLQKVSWRA